MADGPDRPGAFLPALKVSLWPRVPTFLGAVIEFTEYNVKVAVLGEFGEKTQVGVGF